MLKCWIKFGTQKKGQNGEEKLFIETQRASASLAPYFVLFAGSYTVRGVSDTHTPLSVYQSSTPDKSTIFITAPGIDGAMRRVAARVYKLDPVIARDKQYLQKWTAHSQRVGACAIIDTLGMSRSVLAENAVGLSS
jgi:hypothetical protein